MRGVFNVGQMQRDKLPERVTRGSWADNPARPRVNGEPMLASGIYAAADNIQVLTQERALIPEASHLMRLNAHRVTTGQPHEKLGTKRADLRSPPHLGAP